MQGTVGQLRPMLAVGNRMDLKTMLPKLHSYSTNSLLTAEFTIENLVELRFLKIPNSSHSLAISHSTHTSITITQHLHIFVEFKFNILKLYLNSKDIIKFLTSKMHFDQSFYLQMAMSPYTSSSSLHLAIHVH